MGVRAWLVVAVVGALLFGEVGSARVVQSAPRGDYQPTTIAPAELERLRAEFLAEANAFRRTGRPDKQADRTGVPPDLRFDPILNDAAQWFADLAANYENDHPGANDFAHDATKLGGDPSMKDPVQRIRFFGWPLNDTNSPGAGTEANQVFIGSLVPVTGAMIARGWMESSTHYRPFFGYKDKVIGDQTYELVGLGVGKSRAGNVWASAIFGNPVAPVVKLTDAQVAAMPGQVVAEINAARAAGGKAALTSHPELVKSAETVAKQMAARKGDVPDSEVADSQYPGGTLYTTNRGVGLKDPKSFAAFVIAGGDPVALDAKFVHVGVGVALDDEGTPYVAVYLGHP